MLRRCRLRGERCLENETVRSDGNVVILANNASRAHLLVGWKRAVAVTRRGQRRGLIKGLQMLLSLHLLPIAKLKKVALGAPTLQKRLFEPLKLINFLQIVLKATIESCRIVTAPVLRISLIEPAALFELLLQALLRSHILAVQLGSICADERNKARVEEDLDELLTQGNTIATDVE